MIECEQAYDKYEGVEIFWPYAKAVSAKSYNFDDNGNQLIIYDARMLKFVKGADNQGYTGIE